jgi:hypothetical protein
LRPLDRAGETIGGCENRLPLHFSNGARVVCRANVPNVPSRSGGHMAGEQPAAEFSGET